MAEHHLKAWPHEHDAVGEGRKTFEVRSNTDRDFAVGDVLHLHRWDPALGRDGRYVSPHGGDMPYQDGAHTHTVEVVHILHGGRFGLPPGLCVMGIRLAAPTPRGGR